MKQKNKLCFINKAIILYLFFETLLLRWMIGKSYYRYFSIILIFIILFTKKRNFKIKLADILISIFYLFVVIINLISNGVKQLFINNFYYQGMANLIIIIYILILNYENKKGLKNFILKDLFRMLNIYFAINVPILIKQLDGTYFLMRHIEKNPMYADHITGLVGASGTHLLTFYWVILILINLYKQSEVKSKIITILTSAEIIFMIIISTQNDNTAFFVLFPIIILQYFLKDILDNKNRTVKMIKVILIVIILLVSGKFIYETNDNVNRFVSGRVTTKLEQYGIIKNSDNLVKSDEERIVLYKVALQFGNGYGLGRGIGSIQSYGDPSLPKHFGMSEISLRTYEGGIIYLASLILIFTQFLKRIFSMEKRFDNIISFVIIGINVTIMAIYTTIFREAFFALSMSLIIFIFNQHYSKN